MKFFKWLFSDSLETTPKAPKIPVRERPVPYCVQKDPEFCSAEKHYEWVDLEWSCPFCEARLKAEREDRERARAKFEVEQTARDTLRKAAKQTRAILRAAYRRRFLSMSLKRNTRRKHV